MNKQTYPLKNYVLFALLLQGVTVEYLCYLLLVLTPDKDNINTQRVRRRFDALRKEKGVTPKVLASRTGLSTSAVEVLLRRLQVTPLANDVIPMDLLVTAALEAGKLYTPKKHLFTSLHPTIQTPLANMVKLKLTGLTQEQVQAVIGIMSYMGKENTKVKGDQDVEVLPDAPNCPLG